MTENMKLSTIFCGFRGLNNPSYQTSYAIDKYLLRELLGAHAKVPLEHLYLEVEALPLSFVISSRRVLYMQTILKHLIKK